MKAARGFFTAEIAMALVAGMLVAGTLAKIAPVILETKAGKERLALSERASASATQVAIDLAAAYPDSVRVVESGGKLIMEMAPMKAVGRYRAGSAPISSLVPCPDDDASVVDDQNPSTTVLANDKLSIGVVDSCFKTLGSLDGSGMAAADRAALPGPGAAAFYSGASSAPIVSVVHGSGETRIEISPTAFSAPSAKNLFAIVGAPKMWICDPAAGTLSSYSNYPFAITQPLGPVGTLQKTIQGVATCSAILSGGTWIFEVRSTDGLNSSTASSQARAGGGRL
jgi:MSHA biogenesis protein MshO